MLIHIYFYYIIYQGNNKHFFDLVLEAYERLHL
jgi:hypothetical protein